MTQDEIIRMAREAGFMVVAEGEPEIGDWYECFIDEIELFYKLAFKAGVAHEREACAKVCEEIAKRYQIAGMMVADECAAAIRARSKK